MKLDAQQSLAVHSTHPRKIVIAGPGSGKTRTEVEAVFHVGRLEHGLKIAIMTFTNGGAREFRNRIGDNVKLVWCGTTHGYCFKMLQRFGYMIGYNSGSIAILPDKEKLPRLLAVRDKLGIKISQTKLLDTMAPLPDPILQEQRTLIWQEYQFLLKRNNLVDFDGILSAGLELLDNAETVRAMLQLDYLFVDEAQDSSPVDWEIYSQIPASNKFFVGDPDQSIYGFRGAEPRGLIGLTQPELDYEVIKLEQNYRSDRDICDAANRLIAYNPVRIEKQIVPASNEAGIVKVMNFDGVGEELHAVARKAAEEFAAGRSVAVLLRFNYEVIRARDFLMAEGLAVAKPHREFRPPDWERALLLLSLLTSPKNDILTERYLKLDNEPGIVDRWLVEAQAKGCSLMDYKRPAGMGSWQYPSGVLRILAENNVSETTIHQIQQRAALLAPDADLMDLLHDLYSHEEVEGEVSSIGVYVGTMHSAKGTEFDCVFLPAFEQGIVPHTRTVKVTSKSGKNAKVAEGAEAFLNWKLEEEMGEERRLAFVAVTRARHSLYISHCSIRQGPWGPVGTGQPSQFIKEMGL